MKKSVFLCLAFAFTFTAGLFGASSKYYSAYNGEVKSLAIPEPKGVNVKTSETWYLTLIQTQLTDQFRKFSPIVIVDRQNEALADMEIANSENGSYDEDDFVEFGKKANAKYLLIGQLTNLEDSFSLSLRVNNIETNIVQYSYFKTVSAQALKNGNAVNEATESLLTDMGLVFTAVGLKELRKVLDDSVLKGQQSLSKGIDASKRGTSVEAMNYFYQAQEYSFDNSELNNRLNALQSSITTGNIGDRARNEQAIYDSWKKNLADAEQFYSQNPPYEILYSLKPALTNQNFEHRTVNVSFKICAITSPSAKNVIRTLKQGLKNAPESVQAAFADWPKRAVGVGTSWRDPRNISVSFELCDSNGKTIGYATENLYLTGPSLENLDLLSFYDLEEKNLYSMTFKNINVDAVTDELQLKIVGISLGNRNSRVDLDKIRINTIENYRNELKNVRDSEQRKQELAKKAALTEINKDFKKKLRRRDTGYLDVSFPSNEYFDSFGVTLGYEKKILPFIFWGAEVGVYNDGDLAPNSSISLTILGELGINIPFGAAGTLYMKNASGFSTSGYAAGGGYLVRSAIGFEALHYLRVEYSLDYALFGCFADRFSVGFAAPFNLAR